MRNTIIDRLIEFQKAAIRLASGNNRYEQMDPQEQLQYIKVFKEPTSCFERSYFQYLCQKKRRSNAVDRFFFLISNIMSIVPLLFFAVFQSNNKLRTEEPDIRTAVCTAAGSILDRMPLSLSQRFERIIYDGPSRLLVTKQEKKFIREIWRKHPLSFQYVLKCGMKVAFYCGLIEEYRPGAIIATSEDSYTSSVLTEYCRRKNVRHINVMHGEVVYSLARAFFEFDECHIWNDYYKQTLLDLRAEERQFVVGLPPGLLYKKPVVNVARDIVTYYLQTQNLSQMKCIKAMLDSLETEYRVRPHPVWTEIDAAASVFGSEVLEDSKAVSIEESIMSSSVLISWSSTVLYQGYLNGRTAVVDDVSNKELFKQMAEARYIMLDGNRSVLLSDYVSKRVGRANNG